MVIQKGKSLKEVFGTSVTSKAGLICGGSFIRGVSQKEDYVMNL